MVHLSTRPVLAESASRSGATPLPGWPLFRLGFRPFYLLAALYALIAVPVWVASLRGAVAWPAGVSPLLWHAHEMLFGFALAVIVGFLLTAGKAWTGLATPRGPLLAVLAGLWLAARFAALWAPYTVYALLDVLLLPWVAWILGRVLLHAGNRRNLPLLAILVLLAGVNLCFHLAVLGWLAIDPLRALHAGLALIVMIECVIAGRVIPAFTQSALPGVMLKGRPWLERSTLGLTASALAAWVVLLPNPWTAAALAGAALLHVVRLGLWRPWRARARPILWVLHLAYAWLPVGLGLLAWAQWGGITASAGIHALAVGATGGLIIGMVTRTARGHTGRPLRASGVEVAAYGLVATAALVRVLLPLVAPEHTAGWLLLAGVAWAGAFALYLFRFTPWLLRSRLDGKDG